MGTIKDDAMNWLKKNWLTVLTSLIALICGGDLTAGLLQGKSLANVTMLPSLLGGTGAIGTMLFRWLNNRTVTTRVAPEGLDADTQRMLEAIYTVASSPDVTPEMVTDLSNMAAASVIGHANRVKAASLTGRVEVMPQAQIDVAGLRKALGIDDVAKGKK
jgi:hypothetical protein